MSLCTAPRARSLGRISRGVDVSVPLVFAVLLGVEWPQTYRCAGTVMAAEAEVVNGHLPALLAVLAVLRRGGVLRVHDGSRLSLGYLGKEKLQGVL